MQETNFFVLNKNKRKIEIWDTQSDFKAIYAL